nr:ankyrin repeat [Pandoravirus massiliensis]
MESAVAHTATRVAVPCGWETLPVEMRREVLLDWVPDRDLGSCLLASGSFHVLTAHDLEARQYAHATVEGMCFAGDTRGLECALKKRPPAEPVDWHMCLLEAAIMNRRCIVEWIVAHIPPPHGEPMWYAASKTREACTADMIARARTAPYLTARPQEGRGRLWNANYRSLCALYDQASRDSNAASNSTAASVDAMVTCDDPADATPGSSPRNPPRAIPSPVSDVVRLDIEYRRCRAAADHVRAGALQRELAHRFDRVAIDVLVNGGFLKEATSLVTNAAALAGVPHAVAAELVGQVGEACACGGEGDLVRALADSIDRPTWAFKHIEKQKGAIASGAARGGRADLLEFVSERWPTIALVAPHAVANAVVGGHVECVRWLCARGFECRHASVWCERRADDVSALTYALVRDHRGAIDAMRHAIDIEDAARDAFHDAVAVGDLRAARLVCSLWPVTCRPATRDFQSSYDDSCEMVSRPI